MSLKARLASALALLLLALGVTTVVAGRYASQLYFQEVNQTLNASIAMYVVDQLPLIENGAVNDSALKMLAERAMTINPSVEVYLLDQNGKVLSHAMPPEVVVREQVELGAVQRFIAQSDDFPILGSDPRAQQGDKTFSAAPIMQGDELQGYLYVILGGALFDQVQENYAGTFIGRLTLAGLLVVFLLGGGVGFYLLSRMVHPLERLERAVQRYTASDFTEHDLNAVPERTREVTNLKKELARLAATLDEQFEQLATNDKLRRELLTNVSHDLRTPLASMQGYLETLLIKDADLPASERRQYLATAHLHARRLNQLVTDLFQLARLDSGAIAPRLEEFYLAELLQDIVQEFALEAEQKNVALLFANIPHPPTSLVRGDIGLLQRVFENLLANALRHTPDGGEVEITLREHQGGVHVGVRDTGCGIDDEMLPRIFDRYATDGGENHAGLGLAIVKRILDLHETRIEVVSRPDEGTQFSFVLPEAEAA